jgi:hypothetical protein
MGSRSTISIDVEQVVADVVSDAQDRYDEGETTYGAAIEAAQAHLDAHVYDTTEQMFIIETLLATDGLGKETYLYHALEDSDSRDSTGIIKQLCENALTAIAGQKAFDESVEHLDTCDEPPSQELTATPEELIEEIEADARSRYSDGEGAFDATYDTLDACWADLKSHTLTEQTAILQYLAENHGLEDAPPSEQLEDAVNDSTDLVVGSLLWHNLQEYLMTRLEAN